MAVYLSKMVATMVGSNIVYAKQGLGYVTWVSVLPQLTPRHLTYPTLSINLSLHNPQLSFMCYWGPFLSWGELSLGRVVLHPLFLSLKGSSPSYQCQLYHNLLCTLLGRAIFILYSYKYFVPVSLTRGPLVLYRSPKCWGCVKISGYWGKE